VVAVGPHGMVKESQMDETKVLYSNGPKRVEATADSVTFADERVDMTVAFSHAEMREIVLGWERHERRESE
jgi:hypothetical protein